MKKLILLLTLTIGIIACNKNDSDKDAEPSSNVDYTFVTLNDGENDFEANDKDFDSYNSINCELPASSCFITVEGAQFDFTLRLFGELSGQEITGAYTYGRDTTDPSSRQYSFKDKTTTDQTWSDGIVWWVDSSVINITSARYDSISPYADALTAEGNYKAWVSYKSERKVITGNFNFKGS